MNQKWEWVRESFQGMWQYHFRSLCSEIRKSVFLFQLGVWERNLITTALLSDSWESGKERDRIEFTAADHGLQMPAMAAAGPKPRAGNAVQVSQVCVNNVVTQPGSAGRATV